MPQTMQQRRQQEYREMESHRIEGVHMSEPMDKREEVELPELDDPIWFDPERGSVVTLARVRSFGKMDALHGMADMVLQRERQLRSSLAVNREQKAEIERLTRIVDVAKIERIVMKAKLDAFNSGGFADADAMAGKYLEEKSIVDRVWKALGISTYEQAGGKAIDEIVASLRASVGEKWIDVKQQMPPYETPVLVSVLSMPGQWRFSIVSQLWKSDIWHNVMRDNYVTHWQPIVAPTLSGEEK